MNRGATALAVSVGLHARCTVGPGNGQVYTFVSGERAERTTRKAVRALGAIIDRAREAGDYAAVEALAACDFFAPAKYALVGLGEALPASLEAHFTSEIPQAAGLGSGGATVVALVAAALRLLGEEGAPRRIAALAHRGDIVAHGGIASGLDSQTSLFGGAIRYTAEREGEPIPHSAGLRLVIGHSGVFAATSVVNGRVRAWLHERPSRIHYFHEIGLLAQHAEVALRSGDWPTLGRLMNLNQLILERIGVSCPELERLNEAALEAGAYGAKLSGSGGGGIMVALVSEEASGPVAEAIAAAGGRAIVAPVGVPGVRMKDEG